MKRFQIFLLFSFVLLFSLTSTRIVNLNLDSFDHETSIHPYTLVNFYTILSDASREFIPVFDEIAQELFHSHPTIQLARTDVSMDHRFGQKSNILDFPAIKLFKKGGRLPFQYYGPKTTTDIIEWVKRKVETTSTRISSQEDIEKIISDNKFVVLFAGQEESQPLQDYTELAQLFDKFTFVHTHNKDLLKAYGFEGYQPERVLLFKDFGKEKIIYEKSFSFEGVRRFLNGHMHNSVSPFDKEIQRRIFEANEDVVILIKSNENRMEEEAFRKAALKLKDQIGFSIATLDDNLDFSFFETEKVNLIEILDVQKEDLPIIAIIKAEEKIKKFYFDVKITEENIELFVNNYLSGKIKSFIKSSPIPQEAYDGYVKILVGNTFSRVVYDDNKDVLVAFCSPKTDMCPMMFDALQTAAYDMRRTDSLDFARMDTFDNEVDIMSKIDVPRLALFVRGKKEDPIVYRDPLTDRDLEKFIVDNTQTAEDKEKEEEAIRQRKPIVIADGKVGYDL